MSNFLLNVLLAFVPILVIVVGFAVIYLIVRYRQTRLERTRERSPLVDEMLRPSGHSLRKKIQELAVDIDSLFVAIFMTPLIGYAIYLSQSHFGSLPDSTFRIVFLSVGIAAILGGGTMTLFKRLDERQNFELGMEGELATGQELDQLMLHGCRVFHDIEFTYGNIDHVVVSHSGVYSVNTKTMRKSIDSDNAKVVVDHQRNEIRFPDHVRPIPVEQLETESTWLVQYLTSAVGETVKVEPMLALPGRYIDKRIGRSSVYVFNPINPKKFFVHNRNVLSPQMVQRIAHQLDALCRNVPPSQREEEGWKSSN